MDPAIKSLSEILKDTAKFKKLRRADYEETLLSVPGCDDLLAAAGYTSDGDDLVLQDDDPSWALDMLSSFASKRRREMAATAEEAQAVQAAAVCSTTQFQS